MTKEQEAMRLALDALEDSFLVDSPEFWYGDGLGRKVAHLYAMKVLKESMANKPKCPECGSEPRCEDAPQCKTCGGLELAVMEPANSTSSVVEPKTENRLHKWQSLTDQETIELAYKNKGADGIVVWALFAKDLEDALKEKNQ